MNKTIFAFLFLAGCSNQMEPEHPRVIDQPIDEATQTEPQNQEADAEHPCWDAVKGAANDAHNHAKEKGWDKKAEKAAIRIKDTVVETAQEVWGAAKGYVKDAEDKN